MEKDRLLYFLKKFKSSKRFINLSKKDQTELTEIIQEINKNSGNDLYWVDFSQLTEVNDSFNQAWESVKLLDVNPDYFKENLKEKTS